MTLTTALAIVEAAGVALEAYGSYKDKKSKAAGNQPTSADTSGIGDATPDENGIVKSTSKGTENKGFTNQQKAKMVNDGIRMAGNIAETMQPGPMQSVPVPQTNNLSTGVPQGQAPTESQAQGGVSDERLKNIFGDKPDILEKFSKIDAIAYKYNDKARNLYNEEQHVDDKPHIGIKAQDLLENPMTSAVVNKDENGYLRVDTEQLTMTNTAIISELCKRVEDLEHLMGVHEDA